MRKHMDGHTHTPPRPKPGPDARVDYFLSHFGHRVRDCLRVHDNGRLVAAAAFLKLLVPADQYSVVLKPPEKTGQHTQHTECQDQPPRNLHETIRDWRWRVL